MNIDPKTGDFPYPILECIKLLLEHKKVCTYAEIASVSSIKKTKVLEVLNKNKALIVMKGEKIVGLKDVRQEQYNEQWNSGKYYNVSKDDFFCGQYGFYPIHLNNNVIEKELGRMIHRDMFRIPFNEENIKKLEDFGIKPTSEMIIDDIDVFWRGEKGVFCELRHFFQSVN